MAHYSSKVWPSISIELGSQFTSPCMLSSHTHLEKQIVCCKMSEQRNASNYRNHQNIVGGGHMLLTCGLESFGHKSTPSRWRPIDCPKF